MLNLQITDEFKRALFADLTHNVFSFTYWIHDISADDLYDAFCQISKLWAFCEEVKQSHFNGSAFFSFSEFWSLLFALEEGYWSPITLRFVFLKDDCLYLTWHCVLFPWGWFKGVCICSIYNLLCVYWYYGTFVTLQILNDHTMIVKFPQINFWEC